MRVLGIDPGKRGAWCVIEDRTIIDCQILKYKDGVVLASLIPFVEYQYVIIEDYIKTVLKNDSKNQDENKPFKGFKSTLTYTHNHGILFGHALYSRIGKDYTPPKLINPRKWQSCYGFQVGDTKGQSARKCLDIFRGPVCNQYLNENRKPHDGKTDAALIALYGQQFFKN